MNDDVMISVKDLSIRFGTLVANDHVTMDVKRGEIMAVLGENGAGKSTLMKILYGLYTRENGEIVIDGHVMPHKYAPADAIRLGVSMVPQHFMLVDAFSVAENIVLGEENRVNRVCVSREKNERRIKALCEEFGIDIGPGQLVKNLSLGQKQKVEILKSLFRNTKVLILDEPTTVLTPQEVGSLFALLRNLQKKGVTIMIITHKLHEVLAVTDRITVMRLGKKVATFNTAETNAAELSRTMVGRDIVQVHVQPDAAEAPAPLIALEQISTRAMDERCGLTGLSLALYPGKVVGVAGIDGNGQTELVEVLAGVTPILSGAIRVGETRIAQNTLETMRALGIAIIPEDRQEQGLVLDFSIRDNILMGYLRDNRFLRHGVASMRKVNEHVKRIIEKYDVRPARRSAVCRFVSGGNQQKVVLGRELERPALKAVVAAQPARGLDVGAIQFIHGTLLRLRREGKAILLISSDLDDIKTLSDYIAVIRSGTIVAFKRSDSFTRDEIGLFMGGTHAGEVSA